MPANTYDAIPYINTPYSQTHPSRLHVLGRLHGIDTPPVETCRVLELGASEGLNLIGMAVVLPRAQFTGVELAELPVANGNRVISDLGLANVRLLQMNLLDLEGSFGEFDYIIAHGLYAWTPPIIRERILSIVR
ncbi:MAG: class I SAM-dependent methyltransferase, partial [Bryobacteraceae bacterium]